MNSPETIAGSGSRLGTFRGDFVTGLINEVHGSYAENLDEVDGCLYLGGVDDELKTYPGCTGSLKDYDNAPLMPAAATLEHPSSSRYARHKIGCKR